MVTNGIKQQSSVQVTSPTGDRISHRKDDGRDVIFFDIDNCLYSKNCGISELMKEKIEAYFLRIGLPLDEARHLHHHYYTEYGLAIRGLVRHHQVDALDYDKHCDAALPLEDVLAPNPELQDLIASIDTSKYAVWALTNAYVNHAVRVLRLVGLTDRFEGVISCDYAAGEFSCKPEAPYFRQALEAAGSIDPSRVYFVDDSALNVKGARSLGWGHCVLFDEHGTESKRKEELEQAGVTVIRSMLDLRTVWREAFKS